jgi:hypothetical protein
VKCIVFAGVDIDFAKSEVTRVLLSQVGLQSQAKCLLQCSRGPHTTSVIIAREFLVQAINVTSLEITGRLLAKLQGSKACVGSETETSAALRYTLIPIDHRSASQLVTRSLYMILPFVITPCALQWLHGTCIHRRKWNSSGVQCLLMLDGSCIHIKEWRVEHRFISS